MFDVLASAPSRAQNQEGPGRCRPGGQFPGPVPGPAHGAPSMTPNQVYSILPPIAPSARRLIHAPSEARSPG